MSVARDISLEDLRAMMIAALTVDGWSAASIVGYVAAMERAGWLRPNCPAWIRNSAAVYYSLPPASGFGPKRIKISLPAPKTTPPPIAGG